MSLERFDSEYRSHGLWPVVRDVLERVKGAKAGSQDQSDLLEKIRYVFSQLQAREDEPDLLVSKVTLEQAMVSAGQVLSSLRRWEANGGSPQYLSQAAGPQLDGLVEAMKGWPFSRDASFKSASKTIREFGANADALVQRLRDEVERQSDVLTKVSSESAERLEKVHLLESESERAVQEALARIDAARSDLLSKVNEIEKRSFDQESTQRAEFADWVAAQEASFAHVMEQAASLAKETRDEGQKAAEGVLGRIRELERQAKNLVGVIGVDGTSTDFGNYADTQRKSANLLRWGAVFAFVGAFGLFFVTYAFVPFTADIPWQGVVLRSVASIALLAGGFYLARESGQHRREERETRATQLRLTALEPFVVNMSAKERSAIRASTASRIFGPAVLIAEEAGTLELNEDQQKKLLDALSDAIAKIVSRA